MQRTGYGDVRRGGKPAHTLWSILFPARRTCQSQFIFTIYGTVKIKVKSTRSFYLVKF